MPSGHGNGWWGDVPGRLQTHFEISRARSMPAKEEGRSIVARIRMPLPEGYPTYHRAIASSHPDVQFVVLERMEIAGNAVVEDVRVAGGATAGHLLEELKHSRGVRSVERIENAQNAAVYRLTIDMPPLSEILKELRLVTRFPVSFSGAEGRLLVVAPKGKVRTLLSRMLKIAPETRVEAIRSEVFEGPTGLLTPRQQEVFQVALSVGYWDVPRRATLADIALRLHVAKSSISETLAMIEKKLLHEIHESDLQLFDARTGLH